MNCAESNNNRSNGFRQPKVEKLVWVTVAAGQPIGVGLEKHGGSFFEVRIKDWGQREQCEKATTERESAASVYNSGAPAGLRLEVGMYLTAIGTESMERIEYTHAVSKLKRLLATSKEAGKEFRLSFGKKDRILESHVIFGTLSLLSRGLFFDSAKPVESLLDCKSGVLSFATEGCAGQCDMAEVLNVEIQNSPSKGNVSDISVEFELRYFVGKQRGKRLKHKTRYTNATVMQHWICAFQSSLDVNPNPEQKDFEFLSDDEEEEILFRPSSGDNQGGTSLETDELLMRERMSILNRWLVQQCLRAEIQDLLFPPSPLLSAPEDAVNSASQLVQIPRNIIQENSILFEVYNTFLAFPLFIGSRQDIKDTFNDVLFLLPNIDMVLRKSEGGAESPISKYLLKFTANSIYHSGNVKEASFDRSSPYLSKMERLTVKSSALMQELRNEGSFRELLNKVTCAASVKQLPASIKDFFKAHRCIFVQNMRNFNAEQHERMYKVIPCRVLVGIFKSGIVGRKLASALCDFFIGKGMFGQMSLLQQFVTSMLNVEGADKNLREAYEALDPKLQAQVKLNIAAFYKQNNGEDLLSIVYEETGKFSRKNVGSKNLASITRILVCEDIKKSKETFVGMLAESVLGKMIRAVLHGVFETLSEMISYSDLKFHRVVRAFFAFWNRCIETAKRFGTTDDDAAANKGKEQLVKTEIKEYEKFYNTFLAEFVDFFRQAVVLDVRWISLLQYFVSIWGKYSSAEIDAFQILNTQAAEFQAEILKEIDALLPRCSQARRQSYVQGSLSAVDERTVPNMAKLIHEFQRRLKSSLK
jgi:hypothetical protein